MLSLEGSGAKTVKDFQENSLHHKSVVKIKTDSLHKLPPVVILVSAMYFNFFVLVIEVNEKELLVVYQQVSEKI